MEVKPGYKQTEVGVIPADWEVKPLSIVLVKGRLGGNYSNQSAETRFPLMKMGNLARGSFDTSKIEHIAPNIQPEEAHRLSFGDVLFNTRNTLELVGKVAMWRDELPVAYYNSNLMRLEFNPAEICSNEYANAALNTNRSIAKLRALATGTTSVAAIYTRDLLEMHFIVPPIPEQRAIATALSDMDALLDGLDRLIAKKRAIKQATMQQLLTGQTRLPGFSGEWEVKRLGALCSLKSGESITSENIDETSEFPCYGGNGLRGYTKNHTHDGDHVLIGRQGALCGNVVTASGKFFASEHALVVSSMPEVAIKWLSYILSEENLNQYSESSAQPGLSATKLLRLQFNAPPTKEEQTAIAAILSDMDTEITALETRRTKTRALKQAMMQELLTGRTRLI